MHFFGTLVTGNLYDLFALTANMFGKVPPSNVPGPPTASCGVSTSMTKSCTRQSGTTCLPCFSVDETSNASTEDKAKPWRPKDNSVGVVVSEAPCNTSQPFGTTTIPNSLVSTDSGRIDSSTRNKTESSSSTNNSCTKFVSSKYTPKDEKFPSSHVQGTRTHQSHGTKNLSTTESVAHKCSSNPNCPANNIATKSMMNSSNSSNSSSSTRQRVVVGSSSINSNITTSNSTNSSNSMNSNKSSSSNNPNVDQSTKDGSKVSKKHVTNRESLNKEQSSGCKVISRDASSKNTSAVPTLVTLKPSATRSSACEVVYSVVSGKDRPDAIESSLQSNFTATLTSSSTSMSQTSSVDSLSSYASQDTRSSSCIAKDNDVDPTATTVVATTSINSTCADRNTCKSSEFATSTPSKDWTRNSTESHQQNCVSCLPEDFTPTFKELTPTEFYMSSSPRCYKDREKCRDPWRPTEMESNFYGLNVCAGDAFLDNTNTKRRTGASCQALRHAVASLNRLDDFYMEKIGAGFFSEVYKVTHKVTNQVMVLKMNQLPANRPNMLKEVQLMNKLSHPNILRFMGVCVHEGQLHALTEYINGGSLEQLIMSRHTPLPHLIRMNLARDVARGMAYLHSRGLFHRDLTSKNVLIKKDESNGEMNAVVGDFGLAARIPDPSTGFRLSTVGSPYWMSPECLKGQWYDHRSDVFSFGIVVCELIGRVPADPDVLPRSDNFGLDYLAVAEICAAADPPPAFLQLAFNCCTYEPKSRPTFPEIMSSLDTMITNYEDESKNSICKRTSADTSLMSSMDEIVREGRTMRRKTARLRSRSADAKGCDNATPSDKARCHSARRVAELASRRDPHYRPMTANPFHALGGVKKILGDLFSSCLELPSLEDVRPSVTDGATKFKPAQNDSIAKILDRKKPSSEPSSPTARKKWERKVATKVGAASLFAHPLFRDGWEPRRRGSCESGFWSCVGEDLSPEPPNRRHTSTLSSSAASSLFLLDDHRTSSIYTDSSEDIASLGGGDSSCWEDRLGGSSSKTISKIVEYFERKQATAGNLRLGDHDAGPSRIALLKASLEGPMPLCSISAAQRLVVCEGAVRSKLPLFDKK